MSTYKRLPHTKAKPQRNQLVTGLDHAYHWIEHNWRAVIAGIVSTAGVVAIILLISYLMGSRDEKAKNLYFEATKLSTGSPEQIMGLEKVFEEYPRSKIAAIARLKLSDIYYADKQYDKSEGVLKPITSAGDRLIRTLAITSLAAVKAASADYNGAADLYVKAYEDKKNPSRALNYYNAGLAYREAGQLDEAKKVFEELSREDSDISSPSLKEKSKEQLIWLAIKR